MSSTDANSTSDRFSLIGLAILMILSETIYLVLLQLNAINGWQPVLIFWAEMATLFLFYGLAAILVKRLKNFRRTAFFLIIFGTVLFRLTLLPAGLPFDYTATEKIEALQKDLQGKEVTFERYQLFDNDIWRYLWDGHVWANGVNPYKYAPTDKNLDTLAGEITAEETEEIPLEPEEQSEGDSANETEDFLVSEPENNEARASPSIEETIFDETTLWRDICENINYADVPTIYPPLAQLVFRLAHAIAPGSVLMMKAVLVGCELIGIFFLILTLKRLALPVSSVLLYAWNPLIIKVFAGSGHADSILMMMLCAVAYFVVRGAKSLTAMAFGLAILAKLSPIFLLPLVIRRVGWRRSFLIGAVVFIGYFPFLDAEYNLFSGFVKFAREWQFNAGAFALIRYFSEFFVDDAPGLARKICAMLILAIVLRLAWRDDLSEKAFLKSSAIILGALIILSPTVMPWYLSWVLPFAVLARQNVWIYFSALVLIAFHIIIDQSEYAFALGLEHGLFFVLVLIECWRNRQRRGEKFFEKK